MTTCSDSVENPIVTARGKTDSVSYDSVSNRGKPLRNSVQGRASGNAIFTTEPVLPTAWLKERDTSGLALLTLIPVSAWWNANCAKASGLSMR